MLDPLACPLGPAKRLKHLALPFFLSRVPAGFPSPADDYIEQDLDLNDLIVEQPAATFFVQVEGDSMEDAGISSGDVLVVDRSVEPGSGQIVIAALGGELTVKHLRRRGGKLYLEPANSRYEPVEVDTDLHIWGVVRHAIKSF